MRQEIWVCLKAQGDQSSLCPSLSGHPPLNDQKKFSDRKTFFSKTGKPWEAGPRFGSTNSPNTTFLSCLQARLWLEW